MSEKDALREVLHRMGVISVSDAELDKMIAVGIRNEGILVAVCRLPDAMTRLMAIPDPGLSLGMAAFLCEKVQAGN